MDAAMNVPKPPTLRPLAGGDTLRSAQLGCASSEEFDVIFVLTRHRVAFICKILQNLQSPPLCRTGLVECATAVQESRWC
jgi:hypothetical protein